MVEKLTLSVMEAAKALGVGRQTVYQMINADEIEVIRIGRRVLIPRHSVRRIVGLPDEPPVEGPAPEKAPLPEAARPREPELAAFGLTEGAYLLTVRRLTLAEESMLGITSATRGTR